MKSKAELTQEFSTKAVCFYYVTLPLFSVPKTET